MRSLLIHYSELQFENYWYKNFIKLYNSELKILQLVVISFPIKIPIVYCNVYKLFCIAIIYHTAAAAGYNIVSVFFQILYIYNITIIVIVYV